jgi:thymidylate kinase
MMIEFIGSTGSGKTTLIKAVQQELAKAASVSTAFHQIATPLGLRGVTHPTAQNLIQEVVGFPFFVLSLWRNRKFVLFAMRMLVRERRLTFFMLNYLRGLERTIGVYELIRKCPPDQYILVDEGTVHLAHSLFVFNEARFCPEDVAEFASLVPLPHVLIYIRAPIDNLIERSLQRSDPPREMQSKDPAQVERYMKRAVSLFEQLAHVESMQKRILIVDNPESATPEREAVSAHVCQFLLSHPSSRQA